MSEDELMDVCMYEERRRERKENRESGDNFVLIRKGGLAG
jgi:hypothetical protein